MRHRPALFAALTVSALSLALPAAAQDARSSGMRYLSWSGKPADGAAPAGAPTASDGMRRGSPVIPHRSASSSEAPRYPGIGDPARSYAAAPAPTPAYPSDGLTPASAWLRRPAGSQPAPSFGQASALPAPAYARPMQTADAGLPLPAYRRPAAQPVAQPAAPPASGDARFVPQGQRPQPRPQLQRAEAQPAYAPEPGPQPQPAPSTQPMRVPAYPGVQPQNQPQVQPQRMAPQSAQPAARQAPGPQSRLPSQPSYAPPSNALPPVTGAAIQPQPPSPFYDAATGTPAGAIGVDTLPPANADPMAPRRDAPIFHMNRPAEAAPVQARQAQPQPAAQPVPTASILSPAPSQAAPARQVQTAPGQTYVVQPQAYAGAEPPREGPRYYSVHRAAGHDPDSTPLPESINVTLGTGSVDLAAPQRQPTPARTVNGRVIQPPSTDEDQNPA